MPDSRHIVGRILVATLFTAVGRAVDAQRADTIVRNAVPKYAGISSLVLEQRIGVVDSPSEYMFAQIFDVVPTRNGSLFVLDRGAMELRLFDSAGRYVRTVARRGQGPGEFATPSGMAVLRDGRLLLYDSGNRRINIYTAAGASEAQWTLASSISTLTRGLVVDTAGSVHYRRSTLTRYPSRNMAGRPLVGARDFWFRLRSSDGALLDSLGEPERGPPVEPFFASSSRGWRQMAVPFLPRALNAMSPLGYLVTGVPDRYAFEIQQPAGPVVSVRRHVPPEAVTADERRTARNYIASRMREVNSLWTWPRDIPETKPVYSNIAVGLDGRIWLTIREPTTPPSMRTAAAGNAGGGAKTGMPPELGGVDGEQAGLYDVYEPDGVFIGRVQLPLRVFPLTMRGDHVWAVGRDEDDVQFVLRLRIAWR